MNLDKFICGYTSILGDDAGDGPFEALRVQFRGMSSARTAKLLNFAVQCLAPEECYVEIGTFTGYTLISAGLDNQSNYIGIDNFGLLLYSDEKPVTPFEMLKDNIKRFGSGVTSVLAQDFRKAELDGSKKIGVLFIDAEHTYADVIDGFKWAEKYLSDNAVIVLDDTNAAGVTEAMRDWIRDNPKYQEVFYCKTATEKDRLYHNGLAIVRYQGA